MVSTGALVFFSVCLLISGDQGIVSDSHDKFESADLVEDLCLIAMSTVVANMNPQERMDLQNRIGSNPESEALTRNQHIQMLKFIHTFTQILEPKILLEEVCGHLVAIHTSDAFDDKEMHSLQQPDKKYWWEVEALAWFLLSGFAGLILLLFAKLGWLTHTRVDKFSEANRLLRTKHAPKEKNY